MKFGCELFFFSLARGKHYTRAPLINIHKPPILKSVKLIKSPRDVNINDAFITIVRATNGNLYIIIPFGQNSSGKILQ